MWITTNTKFLQLFLPYWRIFQNQEIFFRNYQSSLELVELSISPHFQTDWWSSSITLFAIKRDSERYEFEENVCWEWYPSFMLRSIITKFIWLLVVNISKMKILLLSKSYLLCNGELWSKTFTARKPIILKKIWISLPKQFLFL